MNNKNFLLAVLSFALVPSMAFASGPAWGRHGDGHFDRPKWKADRQWSDNDNRGPAKYSYRGRDFDPWFRNPSPARYGYDPIRRGVESGQLSWNEVRDLKKDQAELQAKERRYLSDGYLSRNEREDLQDERRDFYSDLNHNLHDGERRW